MELKSGNGMGKSTILSIIGDLAGGFPMAIKNVHLAETADILFANDDKISYWREKSRGAEPVEMNIPNGINTYSYSSKEIREDAEGNFFI